MSQINRNMNAQEWAMLCALSLIWGGSFFFNSLGLREIPPLTLVLLRVAIGAAILVPAISLMGHRLPGRIAIWRAFFIMGLMNNVIPFSLIAWGQTHIAGGLASILNATTPLWTVVVAHLATREEKMTGNKLAGVLLGMVGVAVMIGPDVLQTLGDNVLAQLAVLLAAVFYAVSGVYARRFDALVRSPIVTATGVLIAASAMLLPLALLSDRPWLLPPPSAQSVAAVLGIGILSTAIAYIFFYRILASAGATNLMLVTFLIPVSAILLGTLVLRERLEGRHFAGMALICAGLAAIDGRAIRRLRA
jgi:drug/metabolite transporter (DMT)-like permease